MHKRVMVPLVALTAVFGGCPCDRDMPAGVCADNECCFVGEACNDGREFCCSGATILRCVGGTYQEHDQCPDAIAFCDEGRGTCGCTIGATACSDDLSTEFICREGLDGRGALDPMECMPGETCDPQEGRCEDCFDECLPGELGCSVDGADLLRCERVPPTNCGEFQIVRSCAVDKMRCDPSPSPHCENECGGTAVLPHEVCDQAAPGEPPCGVYICNGPNAVRLDHVACLGGGAQCSIDEQCSSCRCTNGMCEGNGPALCLPEAEVCL